MVNESLSLPKFNAFNMFNKRGILNFVSKLINIKVSSILNCFDFGAFVISSVCEGLLHDYDHKPLPIRMIFGINGRNLFSYRFNIAEVLWDFFTFTVKRLDRLSWYLDSFEISSRFILALKYWG